MWDADSEPREGQPWSQATTSYGERGGQQGQNRNREKLREGNVTDVPAGAGGARGASQAHAPYGFPFPPTVPCRRPGPPAAAGRVPRPLSRGPPSAAPLAARSRPPPAGMPPRPVAARAAPVSAGREHPRAPIPGPSAHEKTPCPVEGAGGRDRRRREAYAVPFAARASAPFAVANSAHRVTASGFSSIHARRYAHSAGSPEMPRVGWCRPEASFQNRLL
jgi:hypothetical protein